MSRLMSNPATPGSAVLLTVEDFERICERPENADKRYNLVNGEIVEMPRPSNIHGKLQIDLGYLFKVYARQRSPRDLVISESGIVVRDIPATVRGPDLAYFVHRDDEDFEETWFRTPPLIAVEIISPDESRKEQIAKIDDFLAMGVRYVWTVHPDDSVIIVHAQGAEPRNFGNSSSITVPELPGFELKLAELFD